MTSADTHVLPKIADGATPPAINGNITKTEWNTSVSFTTELHNNPTSVFVTTNSTYLFIGFNISTTSFTPVNDTVPTTPGYPLGYNNATHDWFAVVIDNNIDQAVNSTSIGTAAHPDDAVVLDQYVSGGYDGYANGSKTMPFHPDSSITLTGPNANTVLTGNNGANDVVTARDSTSSMVSYEIAKPLSKMDTAGSDFLLSNLGILQFSIFQWRASQANATVKSGHVDQTQWFSLRVNDTGTGLAIKAPSETKVNLVTNSPDSTAFDGFKTLSSLYGFSLTTNSNLQNVTMTKYDLNIIVIRNDGTMSAADQTKVYDYVRTGGRAMLFLGDASSSVDLASKFKVDLLRNSVYTDQNSTNLNVTSFGSAVPLHSDMLTNRTFSSLQMTSSALNTTTLFDNGTSFVADQRYQAYNLFNAPNGVVYDTANNGYNASDSFAGLSLGVGIDFIQGGRLTMMPSVSLIEDGQLANANNMLYLLQLIPWNSRVVNTLTVHSTSINTRNIKEGGSVLITATLTDGLNQTAPSFAAVRVEILVYGNIKQAVNLTREGQTGNFSATINISINGFLDLKIYGIAKGYGYSQGQTQNLFVQAKVKSFNDLTQLSPIIVVIFIISVIALVIVIQRVRKY